MSGFGTGGSAVAQFGPDSTPASSAQSVVVAANGNIYEAGVAAISGTGSSTINEVYIARYLPNGTLDPSFGTHGVTYENVGSGGSPSTGDLNTGPEASTFVSLTPDGNPVVATEATTSTPGDSQLAVLEFTASGSLNPAFNTTGVYEVNLGTSTTAGGIAVQSNGDIVVTGGVALGGANPEFFAERLTGAGAVDSGFGSGGVEEMQRGGTADTQGYGVLVQTNGDLVFGGPGEDSHGNSVFAITRLTASGQPDGSFGSGGTAYPQPSTASTPESADTGVAVTPDGGYAAAGFAAVSSTSPVALAVARLTSTGQLVSSFGNGGTTVLSDPSLLESFGSAVIPESDGKLLVTGTGVTGFVGPMTALLNADGTVDQGFGLNGIAIGGLSAPFEGFAESAAPVAGGNLVMAGLGEPLGSGGVASFLQEVNIDTAPVLSFAYAPAAATVGVPVQFFAFAIPNPAQSISQLSWDFGSGSFGAATGTSATYTFAQPGTYTVRTEATDSFGLSTIASQAITVAGPSLTVGKIKSAKGKVTISFSCKVAACVVNAMLTTVEHLRHGKVHRLSASGHGTQVTIGAAKLSIAAGTTQTVTLKLSGTGRRLLRKFHHIPASASFELTDDNGATLHRTLRIR